MSSLTQREITFKEIERIFFGIGCEVARTYAVIEIGYGLPMRQNYFEDVFNSLR